MTQKELIEFCKENDPNYNKDASFKENFEPMWSIPKGVGGIGITESEFKNGFYVQIDTKERKRFESLEGKVFYFRIEKGWMQTELTLYNSHWKKYFVPLDNLENWGKEIVKEDFGVVVKSTETQKEILKQVKENVLNQISSVVDFEKMTLETEKTMKGLFEQKTPIVEEFPIQKIHTQTVYSKNNTTFIFGKNPKSNVVTFSIQFEKLEITEQQFSDLVDLMIEARKDLLK